jgi:hypothetical protein
MQEKSDMNLDSDRKNVFANQPKVLSTFKIACFVHNTDGYTGEKEIL